MPEPIAGQESTPAWAREFIESVNKRIDDICDDLAELKGREGDEDDGEVFADEGRTSAAYHAGRVEAGRKSARTRGRRAVERHDESSDDDDDAKDDESKSKHIGFDGLVKKLEGEGKSAHFAKAIAGKVAQEKKARHDESESEEDEASGDKDEDSREVKLTKHDESGLEHEAVLANRDEHDDEEDDREEERAEDKGTKEEEEEDRMARNDSANYEKLLRQLNNVTAAMSRMSKPLTADDRNLLAAAQARADEIGPALGLDITAPLAGERPFEYRRRMAAKFQKFSAGTKDINVNDVPDAAFSLIEDRIYADAKSAIADPENYQPGQLVAFTHYDAANRPVTTYAGRPNAWMAPFMPASRNYVTIANGSRGNQ